MTKDKVGYRYANNEVEGFVGIGFTTLAARDNAVKQIKDKLAIMQEPYKPDNLLTRRGMVSDEELKQLQDDWKLEEQKKTGGR